MLAVLVERGRADAVQLAARQRRLQQVRGIHRAIRLAGADQRVHLVDEQDDPPSAAGDSLSTAFSRSSNSPRYFAPAISAPMSSASSFLSFRRFGHVAIDDAQREAFGDRGLADAGLADQHRIVLGAARQHLDGAADFLVAADHRIELALARRLRSGRGHISSARHTAFSADAESAVRPLRMSLMAALSLRRDPGPVPSLTLACSNEGWPSNEPSSSSSMSSRLSRGACTGICAWAAAMIRL
jgi:hypothetical protein